MWVINKSGIGKFRRKFGQNEMININVCLLLKQIANYPDLLVKEPEKLRD
jgi:hypothetical protein